jgi:hypothetical protein
VSTRNSVSVAKYFVIVTSFTHEANIVIKTIVGDMITKGGNNF